jgi:hypothetical protein
VLAEVKKAKKVITRVTKDCVAYSGTRLSGKNMEGTVLTTTPPLFCSTVECPYIKGYP